MAEPKVIQERRIGLHYIYAAAVAALYLVADWRHDGASLLATVSDGARSALYASLAATSGALLGFTITAITVLLALGGGRRVDWLYADKRFEYVRTVFLGAIHALAVATIYFSILIVWDARDDPITWLQVGAVAVATLVVLRTYRVVHLLGDLLAIAISDRRDQDKPPANPPFTQAPDD